MKRPLTGSTETDGFLDHAHPYTFRYKDPADGLSSDPGKNRSRFMGVLAQDLEKDPYGRQIVQNTPHGKMLEAKPLMSALVSSAGRLHQRADQHEAMLSHSMGLLNAHDAAMKGMHVKMSHMENAIHKLHSIISSKQK